jgi:hypothetical protein
VVLSDGGYAPDQQLRTLRPGGRLARIPDDAVDALAAELKKRVPQKEFNNERIVVLVAPSKCCVVWTDGKRAIKFLKRKDFYPRGVPTPKYNKSTHSKLCCVEHIVAACR